MKLLLFILLSTPVFANPAQVCKKMVKEVLLPSFTQIQAQDHGYRFEKDEKKAAATLKIYDPKKLNIALEAAQVSKEMNDCKLMGKQEYCGGNFQNFYFLQALIHGMVNNGWSKPTVNLGKEKLIAYFNEVKKPDSPPVFLLMSYLLLESYVEAFPQKNISLSSLQVHREAFEKVVGTHQKAMKEIPKNNCLALQTNMKNEKKDANSERPVFAKYVSLIR